MVHFIKLTYMGYRNFSKRSMRKVGHLKTRGMVRNTQSIDTPRVKPNQREKSKQAECNMIKLFAKVDLNREFNQSKQAENRTPSPESSNRSKSQIPSTQAKEPSRPGQVPDLNCRWPSGNERRHPRYANHSQAKDYPCLHSTNSLNFAPTDVLTYLSASTAPDLTGALSRSPKLL